MMRIKKYFSFLLSIAITLSFNLYPMQAIAENLSEVYKAYNPSIFSNTCDITSSEVLESNGKFYMNIEDIAKLARFELTTESDNLENTFILRQGVRKICIQKETGDLLDYIRYVHVTGGNEHIINQITIPYLLIESKYYYECIPLLTYLGAECKTSELGGLIVTMPAYTLWETIVPDMEKYWRDTNINNQSVEEKQWTIRIDVANDLLGDIWSIPEKWGDTYKTGEYLEQALYEVFDVNVMKFESVRNHIGETNKVKNENIESLLTAADIMKNSADIAGEKTWEYTSSFLEKFGYVPKESSDALKETLGDAADIEFSFLLAAIDSYNTIEHRLNYDEHTKNCFSNILNDDVLEYITSLVFDKEEFEAYKNEIKKNENESDFIKKFLNEPIKSKLEEKYGIPKWLPDGYIEFIEFSNIEYFLDWKTKALDISKTLKDSGKLAEDVLREKYTSATIETIMDVGAEKGLAMLVGSLPASFGMLSTSIMTDVVLKDNFEASKSQIYSYTLNEMQYDILEPLTFVSMDTVMDNNCSDPNKLEIMKDMIALYYRITIAFCQNNAKALEEFHVGKSEREQLVTYYNQVAEYLAVYLYMITNCKVTPIPIYSKIKDSVLTTDFIKKHQAVKNDPSVYAKIIEQYIQKYGYPVLEENYSMYSEDCNYIFSGFYCSLVDFNADEILELCIANSCSDGYSIHLEIYNNINGNVNCIFSKDYNNKSIDENIGFVYSNDDSNIYFTYHRYFSADNNISGWTWEYYTYQNGEFIPVFKTYELFESDTINIDENSFLIELENKGYHYDTFQQTQKKFGAHGWDNRCKEPSVHFDCGFNSPEETEAFVDTSLKTIKAITNQEPPALNLVHTDAIIEAVLNNEDVWRPYAGGYYHTQTMWFQDLDLDGDNEFIVGGYQGGTNHHLHGYYAYDYTSNGNIVEYGWLRSTGEEVLTLCLDNNSDTWKYVQEFYDYYSLYGCFISLEEYGKGTIVSRFEPNEGAAEISDDFKFRCSDGEGNEITESQYAEIYNSFLKNLIKHSYTTDVINLSDYDGMTQDEKYERLKKSYDAFAIGNEVGKFEEYSIQNESNWKNAYLEYLGSNANYKQKSGQFALINLNNDEIPDIFCRYEVSGLAGGGQSIWAYVDGEVKSVSLIKVIGTNGTEYQWNGEKVNNPYTEWDNAIQYSYEEIKSQINKS